MSRSVWWLREPWRRDGHANIPHEAESHGRKPLWLSPSLYCSFPSSPIVRGQLETSWYRHLQDQPSCGAEQNRRNEDWVWQPSCPGPTLPLTRPIRTSLHLAFRSASWCSTPYKISPSLLRRLASPLHSSRPFFFNASALLQRLSWTLRKQPISLTE